MNHRLISFVISAVLLWLIVLSYLLAPMFKPEVKEPGAAGPVDSPDEKDQPDWKPYLTVAPYYRFMDRHAKRGKKMSKAQWIASCKSAGDALDGDKLKKSPHLKKTILQELNIAFLMQGLKDRPLPYKELATKDHEKYEERALLLEDPEVGPVKIIILNPHEPLPGKPAVLILPGHNDTAEKLRDDFFGASLAKAGFLVTTVTFRAFNCGKAELQVTLDMAYNGFTLMGMRVYETSLVVKHLKEEGLVEPGKIGLLSHSGGCSPAMIMPVISLDFGANLFDTYPNFLDYGCSHEGEPPGTHCETVPQLAYYHDQIWHSCEDVVPTEKRDYGYQSESPRGETTQVVKFFTRHLAGKENKK